MLNVAQDFFWETVSVAPGGIAGLAAATFAIRRSISPRWTAVAFILVLAAIGFGVALAYRSAGIALIASAIVYTGPFAWIGYRHATRAPSTHPDEGLVGPASRAFSRRP